MGDQNDSLIISTASGKLKGILMRSEVLEPYDYLSFLGIPYAEPPIGELRFRVRNYFFLSKNRFINS